MMRTSRQLTVLALTAALWPALSVQAQSVNTNWRVIASNDAAVLMPGLPPANIYRMYSGVLIGDTQGDQVGLRLNTQGTSDDHWAMQPGGSWVRHATLGVAGPTGPGRGGSESGHVFVELPYGPSDAGPDGQRLFFGRAGVADDSSTQSRGLWRWNGSSNIEIARSLTDGSLGPGLGTGWSFRDSNTAFSGRPLNSGQALISAQVTSPTQAMRLMLARHIPDQGNTPCMLSHPTDPELSPGLDPDSYFSDTWNMSHLSVTPEGRVYGKFDVNNWRYGIWEVCDGAPRALVVTGEAGTRGPDMGNDTAIFSGYRLDMGVPRPGTAGTFFFFAEFRMSPSGLPQYGLFWHDGQGNRPLANNVGGSSFGPGWMNTTWSNFDRDTMTAAGSWAVFSATVNAADGGRPRGLWRVSSGQSPELLALVDLIGAYGPEPSRTWAGFSAYGILSNGDVVLLANTNPGNETALWLLRGNGVAPRRLLKVGDSINVPTNAGLAQRTIERINIPSNVGMAAHYSGGADSWLSADGSILMEVGLSEPEMGRAHLRTRLSVDPNELFADGFE